MTSVTSVTSVSIELPEDPTIDALDPDTRRAIAAHWLGRSAAERGVAVAFEALRPRLAAVGAAPAVLALAAKAIDDERRHAELCARLAARYLGEGVDAPAPRDGTLPDFGTGDERTEVALLVLGTCCINESIASEWIRTCFRLATAPTALAANRAHLQDEIDHARLGWAHFASPAVDDALKKRLGPWLPRMLATNVAQWKKPDAHLPAEGVAAHGHPSTDETIAAVDAAVRDVVLPGFALVGLRALSALSF